MLSSILDSPLSSTEETKCHDWTSVGSILSNAKLTCREWCPIEHFSNGILSHYIDAIMGAMTSQITTRLICPGGHVLLLNKCNPIQITSLAIVYSTVYSGVGQRNYQRSASPVNAPHEWPVTRKMFPFDDIIMVQIFILEYALMMLPRG